MTPDEPANSTEKWSTLLESAKSGDLEAQFRVGWRYAIGKGVKHDDQKALHWFKIAAKAGHVKAEANLGWIYETGRGVAINYTEAFAWCSKAAEKGNANAQNRLGLLYSAGNGVARNDKLALHWFRLSAAQDYSAAEKNLGWIYSTGRGVAKDLRQAFEWYRKAAERGNADAQDLLGRCYLNGEGVAKDGERALHWLELSAAQGNAFAEKNLAWMYSWGRGVKQDPAEAFKWHCKLAQRGDAAGQFEIGHMYEIGWGVAKDKTLAAECYSKAADQGHASAQLRLGWMYLTGSGIKKDETKALDLYRKAANNGHAEAQRELGAMYESGRGVAMDDEQAKAWYRKAANTALEKLLEKGEDIETAVPKLVSGVLDGLELFFPGNIPQIEAWLAELESSPHSALARPLRKKLKHKLSGARCAKKEANESQLGQAMSPAQKIGDSLAKGRETQFDGILVIDFCGDAPSFYPTVLSALLLIREIDPRRYARVRRCIQCIINQRLPYPNRGGGGYRSAQCALDFVERMIRNRPYAVAESALTIVHEATHGAIGARGIRYTPDLRGRIERLCCQEEQRFLRAITRLRPELSRYLDRLKQEFDESNWHPIWNSPLWQKSTLGIQVFPREVWDSKWERERKRPASE